MKRSTSLNRYGPSVKDLCHGILVYLLRAKQIAQGREDLYHEYRHWKELKERADITGIHYNRLRRIEKLERLFKARPFPSSFRDHPLRRQHHVSQYFEGVAPTRMRRALSLLQRADFMERNFIKYGTSKYGRKVSILQITETGENLAEKLQSSGDAV